MTLSNNLIGGTLRLRRSNSLLQRQPALADAHRRWIVHKLTLATLAPASYCEPGFSVHDHVCGGLPDFGIHLAADFASFLHTQISLALFEHLYHALEDVWEVYHLVPFYFP